MTETVLREIVHRAVREGSFRAQLRSEPAKALTGYDVTAEERTAITSGDPTRLSALGIDQRMSKAYSAGLLSDSFKSVVGSDIGSGGMAFIDEGSAAGSMVIPGDPSAAAPATLVHDIQSLSDLHLKLNEQDLNAGASLEAPEASEGTQVVDLNQDY
jgi:hypothetical protein